MRVDAISKIYETYKTKMVPSSTQSEKTTSKDKVELSTMAQDYATIQKKLSETSDIREDLVADIKQRMENGTYNVSAKDVASKILMGYNLKG